jgi:hypothetical protein
VIDARLKLNALEILSCAVLPLTGFCFASDSSS